MLRPLRMRLNNMVRRAVVKGYDDGTLQGSIQVSVLADEVQDTVEPFQHYGFSSWIPYDSEVVLLRVGGDGQHQVVIASARRQVRPKLPDTGAAMLWDDVGQRVLLSPRRKFTDTTTLRSIQLLTDGAVLLGGDGATASYVGKGVARYNDNVTGGVEMLAWITNVTAFLNAAGGTFTVPTDFGKISSSSSNVFAVD